jgi:hypothetical protein
MQTAPPDGVGALSCPTHWAESSHPRVDIERDPRKGLMAWEFEELYTSAFGRRVGQLFLVTGDSHEAEELESKMATHPESGGQIARQQGNGLAGATLILSVLGLILGFLIPMAFLIGVVALVLAAVNLRRGRGRLTPAARGMSVAGLVAGMVCLLLALLVLSGLAA